MTALQSIYAKLPSINCKQKCGAYCGVIPLFPAEAIVLLPKTPKGQYQGDVVTGAIMVKEGSRSCPHLTAKGRCSTYQDRPLICRLWGLVKAMRCPHGCRPTRWLSDKEVQELMKRIEDLV